MSDIDFRNKVDRMLRERIAENHGLGLVGGGYSGGRRKKRSAHSCPTCGSGVSGGDHLMIPVGKRYMVGEAYKRNKKNTYKSAGVSHKFKRPYKPRPAAKRSKWIDYVKAFADEHGITYKLALAKAGPYYRADMCESGGAKKRTKKRHMVRF